VAQLCYSSGDASNGGIPPQDDDVWENMLEDCSSLLSGTSSYTLGSDADQDFLREWTELSSKNVLAESSVYVASYTFVTTSVIHLSRSNDSEIGKLRAWAVLVVSRLQRSGIANCFNLALKASDGFRSANEQSGYRGHLQGRDTARFFPTTDRDL
jgi:hypothetical protein